MFLHMGTVMVSHSLGFSDAGGFMARLLFPMAVEAPRESPGESASSNGSTNKSCMVALSSV